MRSESSQIISDSHTIDSPLQEPRSNVNQTDNEIVTLGTAARASVINTGKRTKRTKLQRAVDRADSVDPL